MICYLSEKNTYIIKKKKNKTSIKLIFSSCEATGNPKPRIYWRKHQNGKVMMKGRNVKKKEEKNNNKKLSLKVKFHTILIH